MYTALDWAAIASLSFIDCRLLGRSAFPARSTSQHNVSMLIRTERVNDAFLFPMTALLLVRGSRHLGTGGRRVVQEELGEELSGVLSWVPHAFAVDVGV